MEKLENSEQNGPLLDADWMCRLCGRCVAAHPSSGASGISGGKVGQVLEKSQPADAPAVAVEAPAVAVDAPAVAVDAASVPEGTGETFLQRSKTRSVPSRTRTVKQGTRPTHQQTVLGLLTDEHVAFFNKYGFILIRGLITEEQVSVAMEGATHLIATHVQARDDGKGEQAFGSLPEGSRSTWGRCTEPRLTQLFTSPENMSNCQELIGPFEFKHHDGPGFYTFAPRFFKWSSDPTFDTPANKTNTVDPYDVKNLPTSGMSPFRRQFLQDADSLGVKFAPSNTQNWHLDAEDYNSVHTFNVLWGTYIVDLPKGNMGNLQVYPGSHHVLAHHLRTKGGTWQWDGQRRKKGAAKPSLVCDGICEGKPIQLCVEKGDVMMAHPLLAHGIGENSSQQNRLAAYCRLSSSTFYWPPDTCQRKLIAGMNLGQTPWTANCSTVPRWTGDYYGGLPGIRQWLTQNQDKVDGYDNGQLKEGLTRLFDRP
jgi:hypothetical protein